MTRRDEILKLIVEHFIKTAEPVASKTLLEKYHLSVSSATIRNDMSALENDGFLEKTHTSSGRVPSEKGYQYYVDHLRGGGVDDKVKFALQSVFDKQTKSVEEIVKESCEILSHMTNLASVVLGPNVNEERLLRVQIIPLSENTATAVFVTDKGYVENKTFIIDKSLSVEEVEKMVKALNDRLTGSKIVDIVPKMEAMKPIVTDYAVGQEVVYQALLEAFVKFTGDRISLYGKDALFNQPEFLNDTTRLQKVLNLLDDPKAFRKAVGEAQKTGSGVAVHIGTENEGMENVSIASVGLNIPGKIGEGTTLTVLGPTRMDYEKVVSILKYFADELDNYFESQTKGGAKPCQINKKKTDSKAKKKK
jgi:heat-inducible transcriptional repressor